MRTFIFLWLIIATFTTSCIKTITTPEDLFSSAPHISIKEIESDTSRFNQSWLIYFTQPIDHKNPEKGTFKQRVWLSHIDSSAPVVMVTEGYAANQNYTSELSGLLKSNQIIVEHRYFSMSRPDSLDWKYLNVEQAANDHHKIIQYFKQLYSGKWITTGISKGGQTAIFHRAFFPNDVDISIPYVAPINLEREDKRLFEFFENVGTAEDRQRIRDFQKAVLKNRAGILPLFENYASQKGYTFRIGIEKAFDLVVLEYPFSFWQWGNKIDNIPMASSTNEVLFEHLSKGSDIGYVSDQDWEAIKPFFYQAYKELGYYAYTPGDLKPLLKGFNQDTISSAIFAPGGDTLQFKPETMQWVMQQLIENNPRMIAIIGENDPWGATSIENAALSNTIRVVMPNGSHTTRIRTLPAPIYNKVMDTLNDWIK